MKERQGKAGSRILKIMGLALLLGGALGLAGVASKALAVGDASTHFQLFVPPNNNTVGRDVALIATNASPFDTVVDIVDDNRDGDSDDTVLGITLKRGQSYVRYIKDGAVNDDAGGKWDGDYFIVTSQDPVVLQMSTKSDWQWDFAPAENKTMRGQSFFIYSPSTSFSQRDVNLVAYEDQTEVYILDVTTAPLDGTGLTSVNLESPVEILRTVLNEGEDLIGRNGLGKDILDPGHTYWIRASKGVTCQYGSLDKNARDGGGFVPSANGFSSGSKFYFYIPRDYGNERELRIISFDDDNPVDFSGWNRNTRQWEQIEQYNMSAFGHEDWIEDGTDYPMYRLTCPDDKKVALFAASWLEAKGLSGTKDVASFASSQSGYGAGKEFLVYLPQPGFQDNVVFDGQKLGSYSHVFLFGHVDGTSYTVVDADTGGQLFSRTGTIDKDGYANVRMSPAEFASLNRPAQGVRPYLRITADHLVTALITNFNDNWMTYTPSAVLPNPILEVSSEVATVQVSETACFSFSALNDGSGDLTMGLLEIVLDPGSVYASSEFSAALGEPSIEIQEGTGAQILTWEGFEIPADGMLSGRVCYTPAARRPDNSAIKNGDFLNHTILIRGAGFGVPEAQGGEFETYVAQGAVVATVDDDDQTLTTGLSTEVDGVDVNVSWTTTREPDLQGFHLLRSTSPDSGYTRISSGLINGTGDAISGSTYDYDDRPAAPNRDYYYKLEVVDLEGNSRFFGPVSAYPIDVTGPEAPTIVSITPGDSRATLTIEGGDNDGDLAGYWIYRSNTANGAFTRVNSYLYRDGNSYTDTGLGNGNTYCYRAEAQDLYGNKSSRSAAVPVTLGTSFSYNYTVAFEDQIGPGKNDWDYNDWVVQIESTEQFASGGLTASTVTIESMARGARRRNAFHFRMRAAGAWTADIDIFETRDAVLPFASRSESGSGDVDLEIFQDTYEALPPAEGDDFTNTLYRQDPATQGMAARIRITLATPAQNPSTSRHLPPYDPYLISEVGAVHQWREGFPDSTEVVTFWPTSPLYGFNLDYVLAVPSNSWRWPLENQKIWDAYPDLFSSYILSGRVNSQNWHAPENRNTRYTYEWHPNVTDGKRSMSRQVEEPEVEREAELWADLGTPFVASPMLLSQGAGAVTTSTILLSSATGLMTSLDRDANVSNGWPMTVNSNRATPSIARLADTDAHLTLITGEERYEDVVRVQAWSLSEERALRWQAEVSSSIKSPPVAADLDGDDVREVIVQTSDGMLYVYTSEGLAYGELPVDLGESSWNDKNILISAAPVVLDVDGDGLKEIFAAAPAGTSIHGFSSNLEPRLGWPIELGSPLTSGLSLGREANEGPALFGTTQDGNLWAWDTFGRVLPGYPVPLEAPVLGRVVPFDDLMAVQHRIVAADGEGNVYLLDSQGTIQPGWPVKSEAGFIASPVVGDLDGDAEPEILTVDLEGNIRVWKIDGHLVEEFLLNAGAAVQATPLLADLDNDARLEAFIATAEGTVARIESSTESPLTGRYLANVPSIAGLGASHEAITQGTLPGVPRIVQSREDILNLLLGMSTLDPETMYDINLDGFVDIADVQAMTNP